MRWWPVALLALAAVGCARAPAPRTAPDAAPPPPAEVAAPLPPLAPAPATPTPPEPAAPAAPEVPLRLRVGLATDLSRVELPCCRDDLVLEAGAERLPLTVPLSVEPAAAEARGAVYRLQVAALADGGEAAKLARRLADRHGMDADAAFDALSGLHRVRVGRFEERSVAEAAQRRLEALGMAGSWVVSEGGVLTHPALRVLRGGRAYTVPGRWLRVHARGEGGFPVADRRYRGDLLVFLNPRGRLNLVNELDLEDYLRGVVPGEMGPEQYPRLEALKAQAVAARTYALRNLGEFREDGYDICATPRCQVYFGLGVEHPLSDRAVTETAGQVLLHHGELVDARYSATCGGHTEDVENVFPQEHAPYLRGVPCVEAGMVVLEGGGLEGEPFPAALTRRLAPKPDGARDGDGLVERLEALAVGQGSGGAAPASLWGRTPGAAELTPWLEARFGAAGTAALAAAPDHGEPLTGEAAEELLLRLALELGAVRAAPAAFRAWDGSHLTVRDGDGERRWAVPPDLVTYRVRGTGRYATDLPLVPGDPLMLWVAGDRLVAVVQEVDPQEIPFERAGKFAAWTRFKSDAELARRVEERYPGLGFAGFEVVSRGVSGRVAVLRLHGRGKRTLEVQGLPVRWLLDVPDTRFTATRTRGAGGAPGWTFRGSGWGHGVGLCQVGSFGMAGRGLDYRAILEHYYTGVELVRVRSRSPLWGDPPAVPELGVGAGR
jgi:stage II sporulation protein D